MSRERPAGPRPADVRMMGEQDLRQSAALHRHELADSFFARLGTPFLRAYHRTYISSPHAIALVAAGSGRVDGFLLGVLAPGPHGAYVLRTWGLRLAVIGTTALLVRPRALALFLRTRLSRYARGLWRRRRGGVAPDPTATVPAPAAAVLSHVAVDRAAQRSGTGSALVETFHRELRRAGVPAVVLLTGVSGPGAAFYRRLGYSEEGTVVGADGQDWVRFRRDLDAGEASGTG